LALTPLAEALEHLQAALGHARADHLAGRAEALRLTAVYAAHGDLMRPEAVAPVREAAAEGGEARVLLSALVRAQIEGGCAPVLDRIADAFDREIIRSLEDKWYFVDSEKRIGEAFDRKQRKLVDQSRRRVLARLEPDFQEAEQKVHTLMVDRGFSGYLPMCAEIWGVDVPALLEEAEGLLEDSGPRYRAVLAEHLREAGVHPDDARYHDMLYLFAGRWGPARRLPDAAAAAEATLAGLGMPSGDAPGPLADLGEREGKRPGVAWVVERVPETVHLIGRPEATWIALPRTLGAAGVATGLARTPSDLPFFRRGLPDPAVTACWAAVFASLAGNPEWLKAHAPGVDPEAQGRLFALWWLFRVRYLAGSARFARFLHGPGEMMDKADPFEHYMHEAVGARVERDNYLFLTGWFMAPALALRGQFMAARVLDALTERFGEAWFADPEAGAWMREAWAAGWDGVEPLAAACDIDDPGDVWPLLERLEGVLGEFSEEV
jgi:hypothetical protein